MQPRRETLSHISRLTSQFQHLHFMSRTLPYRPSETLHDAPAPTESLGEVLRRNPPPHPRPLPRSGHMYSNSFTGKGIIETDPVALTNTRRDNIPPRFELFLLADGETKVTIIPETRVPNASTFLFKKEDHTLGNLLTSQLHKLKPVIFSGYKVPHPSTANFELRVQTDGSITPKDALIQACKDAVADLATLSRNFTKEWELKRISRMAEDGGIGGV